MSLSDLSTRLGAILALIGTIPILWVFLVLNWNNVRTDPYARSVLLLILLLLILNGVDTLSRLPIGLVILRFVLLGGGVLIFLYLLRVALIMRCFDSDPCPPLSLAEVFRFPLLALVICSGGLFLNVVGALLSL